MYQPGEGMALLRLTCLLLESLNLESKKNKRVKGQVALVFSELWRGLLGIHSVAKFLVPNWGDMIDSGIGLSYRPASLPRLAGRYDNPARVDSSPQSRTKN